jgi:hypothetical protein
LFKKKHWLPQKNKSESYQIMRASVCLFHW